MGIFLDDSEPSFEGWLAERLEGLAPGIGAEAERWTRVLRDDGPRGLPRQQGTVWLYLNRVRPAPSRRGVRASAVSFRGAATAQLSVRPG